MYLLPYLEQDNLYRQYDRTGNASGIQYPSTGWIGTPDAAAVNVYNAVVLNGVALPFLKCPSSPFPTWISFGPFIAQADYTGIAGSVDQPRYLGAGLTVVSGIVSNAGILAPETTTASPRSIGSSARQSRLTGMQFAACSAVGACARPRATREARIAEAHTERRRISILRPDYNFKQFTDAFHLLDDLKDMFQRAAKLVVDRPPNFS